MVRLLEAKLPRRYFAEPHTHLGIQVEADLPAQDTFEVRVHDEQNGSRLVAVIELVSPRNKDRVEAREAFTQKCAA